MKTGVDCKCCSHPGATEIDAMLLNGTKYTEIIRRMKVAHPEAPEISMDNLSKHKTKHLLTRPITVTDEEGKQGYIVGHLLPSLDIPKEQLPSQQVAIPDALAVIINGGIRNALNDPSWITPALFGSALDMARKLGLGGKDKDEFVDAWSKLGATKKRSRKKTTVTVEELSESEETNEQRENSDSSYPADIIDVEPINRDEGWSDEDMKFLEGPDE